MVFKNSLSFKHGILKRGDPCLWKSWPAVYMGSYKEGEHWVHMLKVNEVYINDLPVIESYITQTTSRKEITCQQQQMKPSKEQMTLC